MGRVVAIDFGLVRLGVAISDPSRFLASTLGHIVKVKEDQATIAALLKLLTPYIKEVDEIVLGYPLHLNGKVSAMAELVLLFKASLEKELRLPVHLWDERLSSLQAEKLLREGEVSRKKRKGVMDGLAAAIFLQSYLDRTTLASNH